MTEAFAQSGGIRIAYEQHGEGAPLLLDPRPRLRALGLGAGGRRRSRSASGSCCSTTAASARATRRRARTPSRQLADDAVAVLDAAGIERANVVGTSLGGMVAQQLAADRPERVDRLVLACTTPGGEQAFPFPRGDAAPARAGAARSSRWWRCGASSRTRSRPARRRSSSRRSSRCGSRTRPTRSGGRRRPPRRRRSTASTGWARSRRRRSSSTAPPTRSWTPATRRLLAERIPDARAELVEGCRAPVLLGAAERVRPARDGVPRMSGGDHTIGRWIRDRARTTPDRVAIDFEDRLVTCRELDEALRPRSRPRSARRGLRRGDRVATLTGKHARARRGPLRLREGRARPAAALVAALAGRAPLPARRRRAVAASSSRRSRDELAEATGPPLHAVSKSHVPRPGHGTWPATTCPTRTGCCSSTRPARPGSRRARSSPTRTASGRTSAST